MGNQHFMLSFLDRVVETDRLESVEAKIYTLDVQCGNATLAGLIKPFRLVRQIKPYVLQAWMYHSDLIGGSVAPFAGVRAIAWCIRHSNIEAVYNSRTTLIIVRMCGLLSKWLPRKIVSCSVQATRMHQAAGNRAAKVIHIHNGYDLRSLTPDAVSRSVARAEFNLTSNAYLTGMVARFDGQKDHRNLLCALWLLMGKGVLLPVCWRQLA